MLPRQLRCELKLFNQYHTIECSPFDGPLYTLVRTYMYVHSVAASSTSCTVYPLLDGCLCLDGCVSH